MKTTAIFSTLFLLLVSGFLQPASAVSREELQERMSERLPRIASLLKAGAVGENNGGYLEAREELTESEQKLVEAENRDRKIVYGMIAESTRATIEEVAKQRAAKIHQQAGEGVWLEAPNGTWYRK